MYLTKRIFFLGTTSSDEIIDKKNSVIHMHAIMAEKGLLCVETQVESLDCSSAIRVENRYTL